MLLSARVLKQVVNVNTFEYADQAEWTESDALDVYVQLIDASLDKDRDPSGRRFMPAAGATLTVRIPSVDSTKDVTKTATQPYSQDPSIWKFSIASTDKIVGTRDLVLTLTEGAVATHGRIKAALAVYPLTAAF